MSSYVIIFSYKLYNNVLIGLLTGCLIRNYMLLRDFKWIIVRIKSLLNIHVSPTVSEGVLGTRLYLEHIENIILIIISYQT